MSIVETIKSWWRRLRWHHRVVARDYLGPDAPPARIPIYSRAQIDCQVCGKRVAAATGMPLALMRCLRCGARMDYGRTSLMATEKKG